MCRCIISLYIADLRFWCFQFSIVFLIQEKHKNLGLPDQEDLWFFVNFQSLSNSVWWWLFRTRLFCALGTRMHSFFRQRWNKRSTTDDNTLVFVHKGRSKDTILAKKPGNRSKDQTGYKGIGISIEVKLSYNLKKR